MIYDQWALALNLLAVGVLAFIVANIFVSAVFWSLKGRLADLRVETA